MACCMAMAACLEGGKHDPQPDGGSETPGDAGTDGGPRADGGSGSDGGGGTDGGSGADGGAEAPAFTQIACVPDPRSQDIVAGQIIQCGFHVIGPAGASATLSCENESGASIDCGSASTTQLQPFGSNPLPINDGQFVMSTAGRANTRAVVVWVGSNGSAQGRYRFEANIVADDGVNEPPRIDIDCGGDTDGVVSAPAGSTLSCQVRFVDPDPDILTWSYALSAGAAPVNDPTPFGGAGVAPIVVSWRWNIAASEAGSIRTYTFTASDGTAAPVTRQLVVSAQ